MGIIVWEEYYSNIKNSEPISVFYNFMILLMKDHLCSNMPLCVSFLCIWAKGFQAPLGAGLLACFSPSCFESWGAGKKLSRNFCSTENSGFSTESQSNFLSHGTAQVFWDLQLNFGFNIWSALQVGFSVCSSWTGLVHFLQLFSCVAPFQQPEAPSYAIWVHQSVLAMNCKEHISLQKESCIQKESLLDFSSRIKNSYVLTLL